MGPLDGTHPPLQNWKQWREDARHRLRPVCHSEEQAQAELDWIIESITGRNPGQQIMHQEDSVEGAHLGQMEELLTRRVDQRVPLQYVLGEAYFYGLRFEVGPGVLIPRPETELLVEQAIGLAQVALSNRPEETPLRILDLGLGSGAIAVTVAHYLQYRSGYGEQVILHGVDISPAAVAYTQKNSAAHHTTLQCFQGDWWEPVRNEPPYDLILANPPYIARRWEPSMLPEVLDHEPQEALFAEEEGLAFYRRTAEELGTFLTPEGVLLMELGAQQEEPVMALFQAQSLGQDRWQCELFDDYAGHPRIIQVNAWAKDG